MQAYHRGLTYPKYVWFTPDGGFSPLWWTEESNSSCPHWIVAKALNGSFGFVPRGYIVDEDNAFSGEVSYVHTYNMCVSISLSVCLWLSTLLCIYLSMYPPVLTTCSKCVLLNE